MLAGCVAAAGANVGESPSFDTPHDSAPRNIRATWGYPWAAYVTKLSHVSNQRCAQLLLCSASSHLELLRYFDYHDVVPRAHDAHCGHRTRHGVVSGFRQQYWYLGTIHILPSWRYTRQTRYGEIAFSHMHLLVDNRCKLVGHLLQEFLVLFRSQRMYKSKCHVLSGLPSW